MEYTLWSHHNTAPTPKIPAAAAPAAMIHAVRRVPALVLTVATEVVAELDVVELEVCVEADVATPLAVEAPLVEVAADVVDPLAVVVPLLGAAEDVVDPLVEAVLPAVRDRSEVAMARTWDSYET